MRKSMEPDWRIRPDADRRKRWFCILAAVLLAVGIFGNLPLEDFGVSAERFRFVSAESAGSPVILPEDGGRTQSTELWARQAVLPDKMAGNITACKRLDGVDDFQIAADTGSAGQHVLQGARAADYLLFAEVLRQFFGGLAVRRRFWSGEKRIRRFHVIKFIHRTDGKKRTCFV